MRRGILVTFEGAEGCGKSTQLAMLCRRLKSQGRRVYVTREPGGTRIGDAIRKVLLDTRSKGMTGVCETLLYMASRAQLVSEVIEPRLKRGVTVLCDRWLDATVAYQGYGEGVDVEWIRSLGERITGGVRPDVSLYLDLPVEVGLRRAGARRAKDRIERKALAFHRRVRAGFLAIARREPRRFKRLPVRASDDAARVHRRVMEALYGII